MAIKINFDVAHNPEVPTLVLARRNGDKLGLINAKSIEVTDNMVDACEMSFTVYKYIDNKKDPLWDLITNFKLVYCVEWDKWFECTVELDESNEITKTVMCKLLGHAELSQIMLYNVEINTEVDIEREAYVIPTVLYREDNHEASLMHRIMEKAPHYSVIHVDDTIKNMQRTFSFSDTSIYDACQQIAEELNCLFVFNSNSDSYGNIQRTISIYDLESNCKSCGYRGDFFGACPECESTDVKYGYGEDTNIFVTADEIADSIQFTMDTDAIKNCFKLEAGDDLMTATIKNCNPNGTDYIWYISDQMKEDMSKELVDGLADYDELYQSYLVSPIELDKDVIDRYNELVEIYNDYNKDLEKIDEEIIGFPSLIDAYYNAFDLAIYLQSGLMPSIDIAKPSIDDEANKLNNASNISPVAVNVGTDTTVNVLKAASRPTIDNIVLSMAKTIVDSRYRVKVADGSTLSDYEEGVDTRTWTGHFIVSTYSDDDDIEPRITEDIEVEVNADYETFIKRKLDKTIYDNEIADVSIAGLFELELEDFKNELKKYSLNRLKSFDNACRSCVEVLEEQGVADGETWGNVDRADLYKEIYVPYSEKLDAIIAETAVRNSEIVFIIGEYDEDGEIKTTGLRNLIEDKKAEIQNALDLEKFLGEELWFELCSFRREDKFSNENYISEGFNNAEIIDKATEFIEVAQKEIYKSAEKQCSISADLKNLLVINKFEPLVDKFETGNWLRVMADDKVYKLRLVNYSINYDDFTSMSVEFSDTVGVNSTVKSVQGVLSQASSMATSYPAVSRQAKQGKESNDVLNSWVSNGLDSTNVKILGGAQGQTQHWDGHGMLFREYDSAANEYSPEQMKIVNSTMAITNDNWKTVKTAIGKFHYIDPADGQEKIGYGVNGEVLIGKLILGERLSLSNLEGSLSFNNDGLVVVNGNGIMAFNEEGLVAESEEYSVAINLDSEKDNSILRIKSDGNSILYFDENGDLNIVGNITANSLVLDKGVKINATDNIENLHPVALDGDYNLLDNKPTLFSGNYNDLTNKPTLFSGDYNDLTNSPTLATIATSGKYEDIVVEEDTKEKLLYIDKDGKPTYLSIDDLKTMLGI